VGKNATDMMDARAAGRQRKKRFPMHPIPLWLDAEPGDA
jgi:hypothetical protein